MQAYPKVSLILTSYNCKDNIKHTMESIEKQDYPTIEVVIVDGASTDGTIEAIKDYVGKSKYECKWISEKDNGIYDAMNKGYNLSSGEIIAFFNDLFLTSKAVSLMVDAILNEEADGAHADLIYATEERVIRYWRMGEGNIRQGWMPGHPTLYLKREVYEKFGLYDTNYRCSADYEFMVRILKDNTVKLAYVSETLIKMFYGGTSNQNINSYIVSLREAHQALVENEIKWAWWIDFRRTIKVYIQFIRARWYKGKM